MANPKFNRRILSLLALAAGLAGLAWWGRSSLQPQPAGGKKSSRPAAAVAVPNPPGQQMEKAVAATEDTAPPPQATATPQDALDQALQIQDPIHRSMQFGQGFSAWYAQEPEAALAYLKNMPRGDEFNSSLFRVLPDIGKKDPQRSLALAAELATHSEQRVVYHILFDQFAARNPREAVQLLTAVPAGESRMNAVRALTIRWTEQDLESALAWAQGMDNPDDRGPAIESVLFELSNHDPWRAFALAVQDLDGDELERTVTRVFRQLKTIDPVQAGEFIRRLPPGETQTHVLLDLARAMADRHPAAALEWSGTLPTDELQQLARRNVLDVWLTAAPAQAGDSVDQMPMGAAQDLAATHVAERLAGMNPTEAIAWVNHLQSVSARQAAWPSLASGWARNDPAEATRWAIDLDPDNSARTEAIDAALSYWVLSDATAAVDYARSLSSGKTRDDVLDTLSDLVRAQQPAWATDLATSIVDPGLRTSVLGRVFQEWMTRDPAAAQDWLKHSDLSTRDQRKLLER